MIWKIVTSIFMWIIYFVGITSILIALFFLFKVLAWEKIKNIRKIFKKQSPLNNRDILEKDPFGEER